MFSVTYLGHQSYFFSASGSNLLVDPILMEGFGQGMDFVRIYPPRRIELSLLPPLDAVFLSHEHEDHFNIPTLNRLDRRIPIFVSGRSSLALETIIQEMGFTVRRLRDGDVVRLGALELLIFSPNHLGPNSDGEWDVMQYAVRDRGGHGNFFSGVDMSLEEGNRTRLKELLGAPGIWCQNGDEGMNWSSLQAGEIIRQPPTSNLRIANNIITEQMQLRFDWGIPAVSMICGRGFSFTGERAWLNRNTFQSDHEAVSDAVTRLLPGERVLAPLPGHVCHMEKGKLVRVDESCPWIKLAPRAEWPDRHFKGDVPLIDEYAPVTTQTDLSEADVSELREELTDFAQYLYARRAFMGMISMTKSILKGRRPTFVMALFCNAERDMVLFEYDQTGCRFVPAPESVEDPFESYIAGIECWGSDLLAIFRGQLGSTNLTFGGVRAWTHLPKELPFGPREIWRLFHPLRLPELSLKLYRTLFRAEPDKVERARPNLSSQPEMT